MNIMQSERNCTIFIVTGYSGAGKSSVLRALEDLGFYCIDNLPIGFITAFFQFINESQMNTEKFALGIDIRSGQNVSELTEQLIKWNSINNYTVKIIFLTSSSDILLKRFQETRRKHPLSDSLDLVDAIDQEKQLLEPLRTISDMLVDTDQFNIHELRTFVRSTFTDLKIKMVVSLISFGFKYGVPHESNFVYDLRSLPNPYFIEELKFLNGLNLPVRDYLFSKEEVNEYWQKLRDFALYSIEKSYKEGRFFIHLSLGCTGGRHRSVVFAEELGKIKLDNVQFLIKHRDIQRDLS